MSKRNLPKGVQLEFDDIDYWHKLPKTKDIELPNGEMISAYEYMKKFMHESYANNRDRQNPENNIMELPEQKSWGNRNNNNLNRDALNVINKSAQVLKVVNKSGYISAAYHVSNETYKNQEEPWQKVFKKAGHEPAAVKLMEQTCDELGIDLNKLNIEKIFRIYFRIKRFLKEVRIDKRNKNKENK